MLFCRQIVLNNVTSCMLLDKLSHLINILTRINTDIVRELLSQIRDEGEGTYGYV